MTLETCRSTAGGAAGAQEIWHLIGGRPIDRVEDQGEVDTTQPRFKKYEAGARFFRVFWKETPKADVHVRNAGSIVQFVLVTDEARAWVDENVATEGWQWLGNMTLNVDPRMAGQLAQGMQEAGFTLA